MPCMAWRGDPGRAGELPGLHRSRSPSRRTRTRSRRPRRTRTLPSGLHGGDASRQGWLPLQLQPTGSDSSRWARCPGRAWNVEITYDGGHEGDPTRQGRGFVIPIRRSRRPSSSRRASARCSRVGRRRHAHRSPYERSAPAGRARRRRRRSSSASPTSSRSRVRNDDGTATDVNTAQCTTQPRRRRSRRSCSSSTTRRPLEVLRQGRPGPA